ncbi:MAG: WbuC family cupin fold metalloprotein [Patescibacteria group bacterium]|nr:WbuC family cupin fold metalloprotein [Patescibacteria group bacterium]
MISINQELILQTLEQAKANPRHRQIFRFHKLKEPVQRMLNAILPDSYARPHFHKDKPEVFIVLNGKIAAINFDKKGKIIKQEIIKSSGPNFGVEFKPKEWHSIVALSESVVYEIKKGPYNKKTDKIFAKWAPEENTKEGQQYLKQLKKIIADNN